MGKKRTLCKKLLEGPLLSVSIFFACTSLLATFVHGYRHHARISTRLRPSHADSFSSHRNRIYKTAPLSGLHPEHNNRVDLADANIQGGLSGLELEISGIILSPTSIFHNCLSQQDNHSSMQLDQDVPDILTYFLLQAGATHAEVGAVLAVVGKDIQLSSSNEAPWRVNLSYLVEHHSFIASDICQIIQNWPGILQIQDDLTAYIERNVIGLLRSSLQLRRSEIRKIIRRAPQILGQRKCGSTLKDTLQALELVGVQLRAMKGMIVAHPQLAACPPSSVYYTTAFLMSREVRFQSTSLPSLFKRAPWLIGQKVEDVRAVVLWLRQIGVQDLETVLRGFPEVLLKDASCLDGYYSFLCEEVCFNYEEASLVIQMFPSIFSLSLNEGRQVLAYFRSIGINQADITKICKAFPSLLTLDVESGMKRVVAYLEEIGIKNPGRFVVSIPAILGFDVETEIRPKFEYLKNNMSLTIFDIIRFPAYFSYPLEYVIMPRNEFLTLCGGPMATVGLSIALSPGDNDFAMKVSKSRPETYLLFKKAFLKKYHAAKLALKCS